MVRTLALLLLLAALPLAAQPYRWVDENGQVHYSQLPPTGKKAEQVRPPPPPQSAPNQDAITQSLKKELEDRPKQQAAAEEAKRTAEQKKARCENARKQLAQIDNQPGQRIFKTDAQGNVTRADEAEVQQRRQELQRSASENCR